MPGADTLINDDVDDDIEGLREKLRQRKSATPPAAAPPTRTSKAHTSTSFSATERTRVLERVRNEREASSDPGRLRHQRNHPGRHRGSNEERSRSPHKTPTVREERVSSPAPSETSSNPRSAPSRMTRAKILESEPRTSKSRRHPSPAPSPSSPVVRVRAQDVKVRPPSAADECGPDASPPASPSPPSSPPNVLIKMNVHPAAPAPSARRPPPAPSCPAPSYARYQATESDALAAAPAARSRVGMDLGDSPVHPVRLAGAPTPSGAPSVASLGRGQIVAQSARTAKEFLENQLAERSYILTDRHSA